MEVRSKLKMQSVEECTYDEQTPSERVIARDPER